MIADETDSNVWHQRVLYYAPSGAAPSADPGSPRPSDIQVSNVLTTNLTTGHTDGPDPNNLIFDLVDPFPRMNAALGTTMTTGFLIPNDVTGSQSTPSAQPTVRFLGHGYIEVQRPAYPADCSVSDSTDFTVNIAMLGANQAKYLVSLDVTFGDRNQYRSDICASKGKSTNASESENSAASGPVAKAKKDVKTKTDDAKRKAQTKADAAKEKAKVAFVDKKSGPDIAPGLGWVAAAIAIGFAAWQLVRWRRKHSAIGIDGVRPVDPKFAQRFEHDGTSSSKQGNSSSGGW